MTYLASATINLVVLRMSLMALSAIVLCFPGLIPNFIL